MKQSVRHYVVYGDQNRKVQKRNDQKIMITIQPSASSSFAKKEVRLCPIKVPDDVKLYLRPYEDGSYLLRLHNMNTK